jgi:hypothetical protein
MSIDNLPVFSIRPDWSNQVLETLEWKTAVLQALRQGSNGTAAEQRRMLRLSPRRSFDLDLVLFGPDRVFYDLLIHAAGASDFYVPLFHNVEVITTPLAAGATTIAVEGVYSEFAPLVVPTTGPSTGGPCVLLGEGPGAYELFEAGLGDDGLLHIVTDGGLVNAWPKGSRLFPCFRAKIEQQPQFTDVSSAARTSTIRFVSTDQQDWASTGQEGFDSYKGFPVLVREPNWRDGLAGGFARTINTLDNESGVYRYTDVSGRGFGTQTHTWVPMGRKDHAAIRDMLYFLKGQLTGFWMPTFGADFELAGDATPDSTSIKVKWTGYSTLGFPVEGRDTIVIFLHSGDRMFLRITSATGSGDNDFEVLTFESEVGYTLTAETVRKISFMQYSRLAQDSVQIAHLTESHGVSTISANISAISYDRDAPDWDPPALVNYTMLTDGCGFVPALFLTNAGPNACSTIAFPFGFSWLEDDSVPPEDHISYIHQTYSSLGGVQYRWAFTRSTFTPLYGFIRNSLALIDNRRPDRAGIAYTIDWDMSFFTDTNAICGNTVKSTIIPDIGKQVAQQGCAGGVPGWVPSVNTMAVEVGVTKAGIGVGATNQDYTFDVRITANGTTHIFSFPEIDSQPVTGVKFDFHVSIRCDSLGSARFIITSAKHGTAIDQTYSAPESVSLFDFSILHNIQSGGRASNADHDVLENVVIVGDYSVQA